MIVRGAAALDPRQAHSPAAALALGLVLGLAGCTVPPTRGGRALSASDATPADAPPFEPWLDPLCRVPFEGCCDGETLWWCEKGALKKLDCNARPHCGWSNSKLYDCNTSGGQDPTGEKDKECSLLGDAKLPPTDGGHGDMITACGGVTREGCCSGQTLFFCDQGQRKTISCALNPLCGWHAGGGFYDCGTEGATDPSGRFKPQCPAGLPDVGPPLADLKVLADGPGLDHGDASVPGKGCSCAIGGTGDSAALALTLLCGMLVAAIRSGRRSARAAARCPGSHRRRH
jgi:hypothetical protein